MADQSIDDLISGYEKDSGKTSGLPEAGAGHYLKRAGIHGVSALADMVPNLYNLGKAAVGSAQLGFGLGTIPEVLSKVTGKPPSTFMPEAGEANPIDKFLLEEYRLNEPVRPSSDIGGELGAAIIEGAGSAAAQGPMGVVRGTAAAIAKELAKQTAKQAVIGGGAGGGAEIGGQATGGSLLGQLAGGIVGGVVVPSSLLRHGGATIGLIKAAKQTAADIKADEFIKNAGRNAEPAFTDYVGSTMKSAAAGTPDAAENIAEGLRLRAKIPGFEPSVAEMSNAPGLLDMQRKFALLNPKNLNTETARTEANAKAIQDAYRVAVPEAQSSGSVRSEINQSLAVSENAAETAAREVAGKLPIANQLGIGSVLEDAARAAKAEATLVSNRLYGDAFKAAGEATTSAKEIVAKTEKILGEPLSQIKPENTPQTVSAIRRIFGDKTEELTGRSIPPDLMALEGVGGKTQATLKDLHDIRVAIGQDINSASSSSNPTAATRLYNLRQLMPEVDAAIERFPKETRDAYAVATKHYREEMAPRFKEGTNLQVFKDKSINEPKILPDKMVSEYFKTDAQGGGTKATQFSRLFNNPEEKSLAKTGILDIYRQKVVDPTTGIIDQSAHNTFMRDYGRTLKAYQGFGVDALTDIRNIGQEAASASRSIENVKSLAKYMRFDTVDELSNAALKSPATMGNALMRLGEEGRKTFNTLLLDKSLESGTASGMAKYLADNSKALKMSVPKEQLSAVQDIAKALEMAERAPISGNLASAGADMLKNASGISTATVFSQIRAVTGQRSSIEWAAINLAMPALNKMTQTSFASVMENALHSKQSAVALRNYLMAETPQQANNFAEQFWNATKKTGKTLWTWRGPIISNVIGPERYPKNLARSAVAIRSQIQPEQQAEQP